MSAWAEGRRVGREQAMQRHDEMQRYYSAALDEIYRLRKALALEARTLERQLAYKTLPKSCRTTAEQQVELMRGAARGEATDLYAGVPKYLTDLALEDAAASDSLTRDQWEREVDQKKAAGNYRQERPT